MVKIVNPHTGKEFEFLIGADPEIFVKRDSKLVSAYGLIKGDKKNPLKVDRGAVQVDGMALEFNIDPAENFAKFNNNIDTVLAILKSMVPGHEFEIAPVADFGKAMIDAQPKEAKELGCDPDFDAYTGKANPRPSAETPFRTASGHLHVGWTKDVDPMDPTHLEACRALVKNMDIYLGIPSLAFSTDDRRRELYGKAGAFRPKSYGVEYRVLDNMWLTTPHRRKWAFENTILAIKETFKDFSKAGEKGFETEVNGKSVVLKARDILAKAPGWEDAAKQAMEYEGVIPASFYREQKVA